MLQTSDKSPKKPQLQVRFWLIKRRGSPGPAGLYLKFNYRTLVSRKNNPQYWSLLSRKRPKEYPCVQNAECRLHTGGVDLSFLDRLIFLHSSWWESDENFLGAASVISRPATHCQVSVARDREHLYQWKSSWVVLCWKLLFSARAWHPIWFST